MSPRPARPLVPLACAAAAFAAFLPVLRNGFIDDWDDGANFSTNPHIRGFSSSNLRWMLAAIHSGHYHPLTWLSIALDHALWGLDPRGYHLTSLLLHCANVVLFYFIARRLFAEARPEAGEADLETASALAALLFGLHPLRVESVAWASERRDVLSGFFYLAALLFWLRREGAAALACYAASLLSKAMGVTLPFALLILERWPLRERRGWKEKAPFFALAAVAALVGFAAEIPNGAARALDALPLSVRLGSAAYGLVFYLEKTVWPSRLVPIYGMPTDLRAYWPAFVASGVLAAAAACGVFLMRRRRPGLAAASAYYALTLAPVLGLSHFGPQLVADRYSYLACLPLALLGAAPLTVRGARRLLPAAAALCLALGALTWRQARTWRDSGTFWSHAAAADPGCWIARLYLGNHALAKRDYAGAERLYREAIEIDPLYAAAYGNLGAVLLQEKRPEAALSAFARAQELSPDHPGIHGNMAAALRAEGKVHEAAREARREREITSGRSP